MRRILGLWWTVGALATAGFAAEPGTWGVGFILGQPTGLSVKHWYAPERAVDAALAWSLGDHEGFQIHSDLLWHRALSLEPPEAPLPVFYGVGARLRAEDSNGRGQDEDTEFGLRFPVGLDFEMATSPVELFVELVPVFDLVPATDVDFDAAFGLRYLFR